MRPHKPLSSIALIVALGVVVHLGDAGSAVAQPLPGTGHTQAIGIGGSAGLLSGDFSLHSPVTSDYLSAEDGRHVSVRADIAVRPSLRLRVEESVMTWSVTRTSYARVAGGALQGSSSSSGHIRARQTTLALGRQRESCRVMTACGYTLGGVALYTFSYGGSTIRRPGILGVAGLDLQVSRRSTIQVELNLQFIGVPSDAVGSAYDCPMLGISAGWIYHF